VLFKSIYASDKGLKQLNNAELSEALILAEEFEKFARFLQNLKIFVENFGRFFKLSLWRFRKLFEDF
jgi:hypothetical protein